MCELGPNISSVAACNSHSALSALSVWGAAADICVRPLASVSCCG